MDIQFVAGVSPIVTDDDEAERFYRTVLGLPLTRNGYLSTDSLEGVRHFGMWSLREAARSCFGQDTWPADVPRPQATVEFELETPDAVSAAATELLGGGYELVHRSRKEPWGQTVARVQTSDGLLIGLTYTPWMHEA